MKNDECDIIKITKRELNEALRQQTICNISLYVYRKSVQTIISCLFILFGCVGVLIGKLMLDTEDEDEIEEIEGKRLWLLNTSYILNASCFCILAGFYGMFVFSQAPRPIFFSLYFWWSIASLIILITFTLICRDWQYWNWHYYLVLCPLYIFHVWYIVGAHKLYITIHSLTMMKNRDKMDIFERADIKHIAIGLMMAITLSVASLMMNQLSITQCEFVSSSNEIVSHLVLICKWNEVEIEEQNESLHHVTYHGMQQKLGALYLAMGILSCFLSTFSFWTLWRWRDYSCSVLLFVAALFVSFISSVLWVTMDSVCSDQQCIYYGNHSNLQQQWDGGHHDISSIVTKHIVFLNSTTLLLITCVVWSIVIWLTMQSLFRHVRSGNGVKSGMHRVSWLYVRVAVSDPVTS